MTSMTNTAERSVVNHSLCNQMPWITRFYRYFIFLLLCWPRKEYLGNSLGLIENTLSLRRANIFSMRLGNKNNTCASTRDSLQQRRTVGANAAQKAPEQSPLPVVSRKYHLINSPDVPLQIFLWTAIFTLIRLAAPRVGTSTAYFTMAKNSFILLPLFSSACCAIQIALNIILTGMGCVGFNKVFGPLRPLFLSILIHWTWNIATLLISSPRSKRQSLVLLFTLVASWSVALFPEIIHYVNTNKKATAPTTMSNQHLVEILLSVPSMGCVACINKVSNSLQKYFDDNSDLLLAMTSSKNDVATGSSTDDSWLNNEMNHQTTRLCSERAPLLHNISAWLSDEDGLTFGRGSGARILLTIPTPSVIEYNMSLLGEKLSHVVQRSGFHDCAVTSINTIL